MEEKTYQQKAAEMKEHLKRTLPDDLAEKLVNQVIDDDIERLIAVFDGFEKYRDEMAEARYRHSMKIIPDLQNTIAKLTDMLKALDECFSWCICEGGSWPRGPYLDECSQCLGYEHYLTDPRKLYALEVAVYAYLYPNKPQHLESPPED